RDHAAEGEHPEEEEAAFAPLRRGAPGVRSRQHRGGDAEVGGVEEGPATDADGELGGDRGDGGERRNPPDVAAEEEGQAAGGDDGGEDADVFELQDAHAQELCAEGGGEEDWRVPDGEVAGGQADGQKAREEADLEPSWIAPRGGVGLADPRLGIHEGANARARDSISGYEDGGAADDAVAQRRERLVGLGERVSGHLGAHAGARGEGEELLRVARGEVRDRAHDTLAPEQLVGKGGHVAHVDAAAHDHASLPHGLERKRYERADRSAEQRGIEWFGRRFVGGACPGGAELAREALALRVATAREGDDAAALVARDLRDDVRGGAEAVDA